MDIALIGCGRWGRNILRDLKSLGASVHVVQNSRDGGEALALGAMAVHDDVASLPPVAGFVIATPTSTHAEVIESVLPTGRPIFVEKPMTASLESARRLASAHDRLFVMDKWRYHEGVETLRRETKAGAVGDPLGIRLVRWSEGHSYEDVTPLWILAPHDLAIVLHIFGEIPPVRWASPHLAERPELGVLAQLGGHGEISATLDVGALSAEHLRRITIVGSEGLLELRGGYADVVVRHRGAPGTPHPERSEIPFETNMPLRAELEAFLGFVGGGPRPLSDARDGLLIVERLTEIEAMAGAAAPARV